MHSLGRRVPACSSTSPENGGIQARTFKFLLCDIATWSLSISRNRLGLPPFSGEVNECEEKRTPPPDAHHPCHVLLECSTLAIARDCNYQYCMLLATQGGWVENTYCAILIAKYNWGGVAIKEVLNAKNSID